jgi:hypothetical protein
VGFSEARGAGGRRIPMIILNLIGLALAAPLAAVIILFGEQSPEPGQDTSRPDCRRTTQAERLRRRLAR